MISVDDDCTEFGSPAQAASAATAPPLLDHVVVAREASQAPASSASSVAQPPSARRRHRPTDTMDTTIDRRLVPRDHSQRRRTLEDRVVS
ncbi:hypothetical protein Prudu_013462 [Prunus dulcis]|uniref:Uncharacterized protein n=1 Tax=Prunus dulcis TaxID=3755 RepID=A0A4Y1RF66_PRUDU|nr:hypothetical protein Prudu_013462 [Prunus dulcis]